MNSPTQALAILLEHSSLSQGDQKQLLEVFTDPSHAATCIEAFGLCGVEFAKTLLANYRQKQAVLAAQDPHLWEILIQEELYDLEVLANNHA